MCECMQRHLKQTRPLSLIAQLSGRVKGINWRHAQSLRIQSKSPCTKEKHPAQGITCGGDVTAE